MGDVVGGLVAAVDSVCSVDPAGLADGESIVELHRQLERLEAVVTRCTVLAYWGYSQDKPETHI